MKVKILLFLTFLSFLHAAPIGNPSAPALLDKGFFIPCNSTVNIRLGYEGDFVTDGRMKQTKKGDEERVDNYKQDTNSGTLTLNFVGRFDLMGVLGASRTSADWRSKDAADVIHRIELETRRNFLWAIAGNGVLFEWGRATLGAGGRYSWSRYNPAKMESDGRWIPASGARVQWEEWQVDLGLSYRIDLFVPYIGGKYSNVKTKLSNFPIGNGSFENKTPVGLYLGCSLTTGAYFFLNLEARLFDEEAFTVSGDLRF